MIKPELKPLQPVLPGYAQLLLKGWDGEQEEVFVSIQSNQGNQFLDGNGLWVSSEVYLALPPLNMEQDVAQVQVGPSLVDALLANRQAAYRLTVKDGEGLKEFGILTMLDGLLSSQAGGENLPPVNTHKLQDSTPEPAAAVVEPVPEPIIEPVPVIEPTAAPTPAKGNKLPLIIAGIVILALLGGAAWWFTRAPAEPAAPAGVAAKPATESAGPCGDELMSKGNELEFVKGCLRSQPSSAQLLGVIEKAKTEKRCDIAQRLYAYKAQSGDTQMALRYAQEYDPKTAVEGSCFTADPQTAIYWYENIANQDPQNTEVKNRLAELKK
ncbi:hypothetical protein KC222_10050 [Cedecea davisae]|uniref:Uncharacterized protein n=1 Tax=Cedecea davisae TaxID=158484 RepID=A0ABS6DGM2_9ENTR|nr:hypothetical protein [Cedecea davisae]MBU4682356.1 hypothetical protein [Cedecea davisae]MBU4688454.1 hypothetical protein [Cedecea davisae]